MGGINRERRQHREDVEEEVILKPPLFGRCDMIGIDQDDTALDDLIAQFAPAALLIGSETAHFFANDLQLLRRCAAILRDGSYAVAKLPALMSM